MWVYTSCTSYGIFIFIWPGAGECMIHIYHIVCACCNVLAWTILRYVSTDQRDVPTVFPRTEKHDPVCLVELNVSLAYREGQTNHQCEAHREAC